MLTGSTRLLSNPPVLGANNFKALRLNEAVPGSWQREKGQSFHLALFTQQALLTEGNSAASQ